MSKFLRIALGLLLASCSLLAQAELYTWVDKNGKKNYGDKVPPEYAKDAKVVESKKANTMEKPPSVYYYQTPRNNQGNQQEQGQMPAPVTADSSCAAQQQAYEDSLACYNDCRRQGKNRQEHYNNVSACGHCVDVKKPNCE